LSCPSWIKRSAMIWVGRWLEDPLSPPREKVSRPYRSILELAFTGGEILCLDRWAREPREQHAPALGLATLSSTRAPARPFTPQQRTCGDSTAMSVSCNKRLMHRNNWLLRPPNLHITPVVRRDFVYRASATECKSRTTAPPHRPQRVFREHQRRFSNRTSRQLR
jgi:hypothetical protein